MPHADVLDVIDRCLNFDPQARPTFKDIEASLSAIMTECVAVLKNSKHSKRSSAAGNVVKAGAEDGAVRDHGVLSVVELHRQCAVLKICRPRSRWWSGYGYAGQAYCQRCSEVFRDHLIRQKSNSARCGRAASCDDCAKVCLRAMFSSPCSVL